MVSGASHARLDPRSKIVLCARHCGPQRRAESAETLVEARPAVYELILSPQYSYSPCSTLFVLCANKNRSCLPRLNRCRELMGMMLAPDDLQLERLRASWAAASVERISFQDGWYRKSVFRGSRSVTLHLR